MFADIIKKLKNFIVTPQTSYLTSEGIAVFPSPNLIPNNFEGCCVVRSIDPDKHWYKLYKGHRVYHREDGPAHIMFDMFGYPSYYWYNHGKFHRNDGPAVINEHSGLFGSGGTKEYWINNEQMSEQDYWNHPLIMEYKLKKIMEL